MNLWVGKFHLSAILNFLESWVTEFVWTVLPHSLTFEATIFDAILTGRSFSFFISRALELALMWVEPSLETAECYEIRGNLTLGIKSSSSSTVKLFLLMVGMPSDFLLSWEASLFSKINTTSLTYSWLQSSAFFFLIDFRSYTWLSWPLIYVWLDRYSS